jgi:hypothetical protein
VEVEESDTFGIWRGGSQMTAQLEKNDEGWAAELEGSVERLERAARRSAGDSADVGRSRLRFLDASDDDADEAPAEEPERRVTDRRMGERRSEDRRSEDRQRAEVQQHLKDPKPEHVEIARSATEAARAATTAARLATNAARTATEEAGVHAKLAQAANKTAMTALMIAAAAGGATIALAIGLVVIALLLK